jgi:hypothetical protein
MQGVSFSDLPQQMLESAHTAPSSYSGGHDASMDGMLSSATHQTVPTMDHMPEHFALPMIPHSEFHLH